MAIWGQTVKWNGPAAFLSGFDPVRLLFHPLDPGYYAVFARFMVSPHGGTVMWEHAAWAKISLGSASDEDYARLVCTTPSGEDAIKGSTPLELMTVGESTPDGEGGVDVVVRGSGAVIGALRLNIISLDEIRDPAEYEGSFPLSREDDDAGIHIRDYSRDIYVSPAKGLRTTPEGPQG